MKAHWFKLRLVEGSTDWNSTSQMAVLTSKLYYMRFYDDDNWYLTDKIFKITERKV